MQAIVLRRQPGRQLRPDDFESRTVPTPGELREGEVRLRVRWLSIDPYLRGLLDPVPMFGRPVRVGDVMAGRGIGEVIESRSARFVPGDHVIGETGWATGAVASADGLLPVPAAVDSLPLYLGVLGVPGLTAYLGLAALGGVGEGDVLLVSSAAGAVGSAVAQLARKRGATVIGLTSGPVKTALLRDRLGLDRVIDRQRQPSLAQALREAAPDGLTCFFDNVGEQTLVDGLAALRPRGRALLCGYIAGYETDSPLAPAETLRVIMRQRLEVRGFLVHDHAQRFGEARRVLEGMVEAGDLQPLQTVAQGLAMAPAALCDLLAGRGAGKMLVAV